MKKRICLLKVLILGWLCLVTIAVSAQADTASNAEKVALPLDGKQIIFTQSWTLKSSVTKNQVTEIANEWFKNSFKAKKDKVEAVDKEKGNFLATGYRVIPGVTYYNYPVSPVVKFSVEVTVQDNVCTLKLHGLKSLFKVFNEVEVPVEEEYNNYLNNKNKKGSFVSREEYNKHADTAFKNLKAEMTRLTVSFKGALGQAI
ncbi:DUF4468 domain-containing protein [Mucilaginibacter sp. RS28]|uniref:DUF4468 domain-containing protein n=1 Tax=Mucilaginibacter straminoryzae TaxID=2932774 RepID=A0A9X1X643_9SPHI|nr:DUF4468 domain-containing protein [Mucilaginibacter straminoryzae]MCJ8211628.1 DUF4468 domain-containing protein [Mucilaginibacter straminoryzae]